ncbi:DUF3243 domain-containing protein [Numidum massiliense]|uniref:DUF3243 domain-containing protein n=1 Tax=Numidum massiliense TaxID=1522315 RepID=UPI0006D575CF|nr:DUF3243 domain-containing protein [Numidum massiliense]
MSVMDNFADWKQFLQDRVQQAHGMGMSDDTISNVAYQIGDYLAQKVDPENREQRLLQDMWSVSSDEEQRALASVMVKLVEHDH